MAKHDVDQKEVFGHLRTVFKGAKDWDGGRKLRIPSKNALMLFLHKNKGFHADIISRVYRKYI